MILSVCKVDAENAMFSELQRFPAKDRTQTQQSVANANKKKKRKSHAGRQTLWQAERLKASTDGFKQFLAIERKQLRQVEQCEYNVFAGDATGPPKRGLNCCWQNTLGMRKCSKMSFE